MVTKSINLALQGGGSHGAYTWGVLDRLLEEEDLAFGGISGTSAGAMNGAVMVSGYLKNGRQGAKDALTQFWTEVGNLGRVANPFPPSPFEQWQHHWNLDWSLSYNMFDMMSRMFSPYQFNPLNLNPLRWVLEQCVDIKAMHESDKDIPLYITATAVQTGQPRVFQCHEISIDAILASACIPFIFQAVEIEGEPYWDGGYMGNPVLWPLYRTESADVLLVQINPLFREGTPHHAFEIINRLNEISFNSSLIAEMRAINFVSRMVHENRLDTEKYRDIRMHMITVPEPLQNLDASSKMNATWEFFTYLHQVGRDAAEHWLKDNKKAIGKHATVDIAKLFLTKYESVQSAKRAEKEAA